jgi:hypothetical protein
MPTRTRIWLRRQVRILHLQADEARVGWTAVLLYATGGLAISNWDVRMPLQKSSTL